VRLRYLRVRQRPPLQDINVEFHREELLGLTGAIHFVIGVNGTGKSRLLQVIAETFLALEQGGVPSYPVTLAYDLKDLEDSSKERTVCFHSLGTQGSKQLVEFEGRVEESCNWKRLWNKQDEFTPSAIGESIRDHWDISKRPNRWPDVNPYLPDVMLAYTSGAQGGWERLFAPPVQLESEILTDLLRGATAEQEKPYGWRPPTFFAPTDNSLQSIGIWIRGEDYRFALLAVVLSLAKDEFAQELRDIDSRGAFRLHREESRRLQRSIPERFDDSLRSVLDEVDWLWPVTVSLRTTAPENDPDWQELSSIATAQFFEPKNDSSDAPQGRYLHFDLVPQKPGENRALSLFRVLCGMKAEPSRDSRETTPQPLTALRRLLQWQRRGFLQSSDVKISLRKVGAKDPLILESLSDGERMFLGRLALLFVLGDGDNALALLDEPETHFNDYWKREIVDILDRKLRERANNIVLTTHSSIALTDAFDREITLLRRCPDEPNLVLAAHPVPPTFGASPAEVLQEIFMGPRSIGQRSTELLDTLLVLLADIEVAESLLMKTNLDVHSIPQSVRDEMYRRGLLKNPEQWTDEEVTDARRVLDERLAKTIKALSQYGTNRGYEPGKMLERIVEMLIGLANEPAKIGAGYYRLELGRRLTGIQRRRDEIKDK
jgi:ABC-type Mn2+/Zn2+ transport system ATPase subunit